MQVLGLNRFSRIAAAGAAIVVVVAGTAVVAYAAGTNAGRAGYASSGSAVSTTGFPVDKNGPGIFTDRCAYSHQAADDPILAPGKRGASMHHDFFGNTGTDASSTAASLRGGKTTCSTSADASAYWIPVLYQNGKALTPKSSLIYWRQRGSSASSVHTIPEGLQMIAGDESGMTTPSTKVIRWTCQPTRGMKDKIARKANQGSAKATGGAASGSGAAAGGTAIKQRQDRRGTGVPHDCASGTDLKLTVTFPSCWDGHTLDGSKQANVTYAEGDSCSKKYPVEIPEAVFHVIYPTSSASGITLSMSPTTQGSPTTEHVDFISGWNNDVLAADVKACIATNTRCGPASGPQAIPRGPGKRQLAKMAHEKKMHANRMQERENKRSAKRNGIGQHTGASPSATAGSLGA